MGLRGRTIVAAVRWAEAAWEAVARLWNLYRNYEWGCRAEQDIGASDSRFFAKLDRLGVGLTDPKGFFDLSATAIARGVSFVFRD